ncbi:hypothetical protein SAMN05216464_112130 [Mucilaginibacter pineti]|uniref:Uncharacterized protein n=1 Tax=Mucilaginibacter pineti TaxID=1391627 RepID=A0A1G7I3H8_9SPHI|nr:hypothetical protein SAMN05216464_112130 [Mucilaginibacter pineti]
MQLADEVVTLLKLGAVIIYTGEVKTKKPAGLYQTGLPNQSNVINKTLIVWWM